MIEAHFKAYRLPRRILRGLGAFLLFYVLAVLCGLIPVNNNYRPPQTDGVTIYVRSNAVHADIILPVVHNVIDWRNQFPLTDFQDDVGRFEYVAIGWGDRGFFLKTPEWKDLRWTTTANAILWPSDTVMHVQYTTPESNDSCRAVTISCKDYEKLVKYVLKSFASTPDKRTRLDYSYNRRDAFYNALGKYHMFHTCNCWVGRGLKVGGVRTPWFSPLPKTVLWYLPDPN